VPVERLTAARARIRKQRNRLLSLGSAEPAADFPGAVTAGLRAAADGPASPPTSAMTLEGVRAWAERVHGTGAKDGWPRMFPPGRHLWGALRAVYEFVEHWGAGGGLMRPMHAEFLREADASDELRGIWARLDVLADQANDGFPLDTAAVDELLRGLQPAWSPSTRTRWRPGTSYAPSSPERSAVPGAGQGTGRFHVSAGIC
jgi:hypothetical protein